MQSILHREQLSLRRRVSRRRGRGAGGARQTHIKRRERWTQAGGRGYHGIEVGTNISEEELEMSNGKDAELLLFFSAETEILAHKVAHSNSKISLGNIRWQKFADGFPNLFVRDAESMRNKHVAFLASFDRPDVIFEQLSIIYALPRMFVASFTLVLPFFPTGTAERIEDEGEIATAFTLARMLSNIPLSRGGPTSLVTYDIHALQERFYFGDNVLPLFESGIPLLKRRLHELPDSDLVTIAYPDEGAWKRFHKMFGDSMPQIICTKVRDQMKRIVRVKEGEPEGRHVVIIDDLVQSGGTLIECQRVLAEMGANSVSAYVTHGVFPNNSFERFLPQTEVGGASSGFKYFWLTDSCPKTIEAIGKDRKPFEVLSLAETIASNLMI